MELEKRVKELELLSGKDDHFMKEQYITFEKD